MRTLPKIFKMFFFLIIVLLNTFQLFSTDRVTNKYGLYLFKSDGKYKLSDCLRLMANDTIFPNIKYSQLKRYNEMFEPYKAFSGNYSKFIPQEYKVKTYEYKLKELDNRILKVKIDIPENGDKPCPFIVFIHGGGWHIGNEEGFSEQSKFFAANGIAGVRISYTLIPEGGNIEIVIQELKSAMQLINQHAKELGLDMNRFGFCGDSAGGYLSSYMAMTTPGTKLYIGICGMYNLLKIDDGYFPGKEGLIKFFKTDDYVKLHNYSPINLIPSTPPLTLLMHGTADPTINCRQSMDFAEAIRSKGGDVKLSLYEGYGHLFSLKRYSNKYYEVLKRMIDFAKDGFSCNEEQHSNILMSGDKISFIGNSITHNGYHLNYLMQYYATRFPYMPIWIKNAGISGDTTEDINKRINNDIYPYLSDVNVVMSGMNDAFRYYPISENDSLSDVKRLKSIKKYRKEINKIVTNVKETGNRLVLFTPSIYDETVKNNKKNNKSINTTLKEYRNEIIGLSKKYDIPVVDQWKKLLELNGHIQKEDSTYSIIGQDRVHPGFEGGFAMAYFFLEKFNEPGIVSVTNINCRTEKYKVQNAVLSDLNVEDSYCSFKLLEKSLPFPVDSLLKNVIKYIPFQERFNKEILKVRNLKEGNYELIIDDVSVGIYSSDELNNGINLALNINTPQYKQAMKISNICKEIRWKVYNIRRLKLVEFQKIGVEIDFNDEDLCINKAKELKNNHKNNDWILMSYKWYIVNKKKEHEMINNIENLHDEMYSKAQPVVHSYQLRYISNQ